MAYTYRGTTPDIDEPEEPQLPKRLYSVKEYEAMTAHHQFIATQDRIERMELINKRRALRKKEIMVVNLMLAAIAAKEWAEKRYPETYETGLARLEAATTEAAGHGSGRGVAYTGGGIAA